MDPRGCPDPLWVTDNAFELHLNQPCQSPLLGWILTFTFLTSIKTYVVIGIWRVWFFQRRQELRKKTSVRRYPIVPTLTTATVLCYYLLLVLVATNTVNAYNGGAFAIYSVMCFLWGIYTLLFIRKYVRAGKRLIPLALAHRPPILVSSGADKSASIETKIRMLNTFDLPLRILLGSQVFALIVTLITGGILFPSQPDQRVFMRISFGFIGSFGVLLAFALIHQGERLIQATKYSLSLLGEEQRRSEDASKAFSVIRLLRLGQVVWFVTGGFMGTVHMVIAADALSPYWYIIFLMLTMETIASSFSFFSSRPKGWKGSDQPLSSPSPLAPKRPVGANPPQVANDLGPDKKQTMMAIKL